MEFSQRNRRFYLALCGFLLFLTISVLKAEDASEYFEMSLEELLDVPIISASRTEQSSTQLAIPVSVITADEIHAGGFTTIPDILMFMPGVDVRRVDRVRYIVGVRGMASHVSDRTLVLINGRNALDLTYGAPDWLLLPVMIEDIERIEVLRGPGGAAWGANAFTGVINIITKKPSDKLENIFSTTISEFGDTYTHMRFAGSKDKWSWRVSAGYQNIEDSDNAGAGKTDTGFPALNGLIGFDSYVARDFSRTGRFDTEFRYQYSDITTLSFGAAYSGLESGDRELVGRYPAENVNSNMTRLFARADYIFDDETSAYLQWYGNYVVSHQPHLTDRYAYYENDLEAQYNMILGDEHSLTVGGNLRWIHLSSENHAPTGEIEFNEGGYDEYWGGLFAIDRMRLTDRLTVEAQGRLDRYSETSTDWSVRFSSLYALDDEENHVLRAGFGRAFRAPGPMVRETTLTGLGGLINIIPNRDKLYNESTYAVEAGYTGKFSDHLTFQANTYYQRMEHLLGNVTEMVGPVTNAYFDNLDGANTYGAECELTYKMKNFQFTSWYSYNEFVTDDSDQPIRAYFPARHKAGLRTRYAIDDNWSVNANYIYNDAIHVNSAENPAKGAEMFHRLDLTLSHTFANQQGEFMVGVADVFNKTYKSVYDVSYLTSYETPGRTFFARFQYKF